MKTCGMTRILVLAALAAASLHAQPGAPVLPDAPSVSFASPSAPAPAGYRRGPVPWSMRAGVSYLTGALKYSSPWQEYLSYDLPKGVEGTLDYVFRNVGRSATFQWSGGVHLGYMAVHAGVSGADSMLGEAMIVNTAIDESYYHLGVQSEVAVLFGNRGVRPGLSLAVALQWYDRIQATGSAETVDGSTTDYDIKTKSLVPRIALGGLLQFAQPNRIWAELQLQYAFHLESILTSSEATMKPDGFSASARLYFW